MTITSRIISSLIHTVTRIRFRQLEKFFILIAFPTSAGETAVTALTWRRRSISPSCSIGVWTGHGSPCIFRNSGTFIHLPVSCFTCNPRETSSTTFSSPGMCLHWLGSELFWISPTRAETNFPSPLLKEKPC